MRKEKLSISTALKGRTPCAVKRFKLLGGAFIRVNPKPPDG